MAVTRETRRVISKASLSVFPTVGKVGVVYIAEDTDTAYFWDKDTASYVAENAAINNRLTNLENINETRIVYKEISGTTTGSVTGYSPTVIDQRNWVNTEDNAEVKEINASGVTGDEVFTSTNTQVRGQVEADGTYTLSGTPTATRYAITWKLTGTLQDFGTANIPSSAVLGRTESYSFYRDPDTNTIYPSFSDDLDMLNGNLENLGYIDFDMSIATAIQEGRVQWNAEAGTLSVGLANGSSIQVGQENVIRSRANGSNILDGQAVYISGSTGSFPEVTLADRTSFAASSRTIAIATQDINQNSFGYVTTFGIVRDIDTSAFSESDILYIGSTSGSLTNVKPEAPDCIVRVGYCIRSHATEGIIFVKIEVLHSEYTSSITQEPTGFKSPQDVVITGDPATATISLSGTVEAYYRGEPISEFVDGYTSIAHPTADTTKEYFLYYNGTDIAWLDISATPLGEEFYANTLVTVGLYLTDDLNGANSDWRYVRECHGLMQWQGHRADHYNIGTYKRSGGAISGVVLDSTVADERRPRIAESLIYDEDLPTVNEAFDSTELAARGYTLMKLLGADSVRFNFGQTDIIRLNGNRPYYNQLVGGVWQETLFPTGDFGNVYLIEIPSCADQGSQDIRRVYLQPQRVYDKLEDARAESPASLIFGKFLQYIPESVITKRLTVEYIGGNWNIAAQDDIGGSRTSPFISNSPIGLTQVSTNDTINGSGTVDSPLGMNLANANTWTADQTFSTLNATIVNSDFAVIDEIITKENLITVNTVGTYTVASSAKGKTVSVIAAGAIKIPTDATNIEFQVGDYFDVEKTADINVKITRDTSIVFEGGFGDVDVTITGKKGLRYRCTKLSTTNWLIRKISKHEELVIPETTGFTIGAKHVNNIVEINNGATSIPVAMPNDTTLFVNKNDTIRFRKLGTGDVLIVKQPITGTATFRGNGGDIGIYIAGTGDDGNVVELQYDGSNEWIYRGNWKE